MSVTARARRLYYRLFKIRNAKVLLAVTTVLIPWNVFAFGRGFGWGLMFPFGRLAVTPLGTQFLFLDTLITEHLRAGGDPLPMGLWLVAGVLVVLAAVYAVLGRTLNGDTRRWEDRLIGLSFLVASVLFLVGRFLVYDFLLVGQQSDVNWFSVPFGAVYVLFVGYVFYRGRFRLGAD